MNSWQSTIRDALSRAYKYSGAMWLHERIVRPRFLTILLFHRVTDAIPPDGLTVGLRQFHRICDLLRSGFHVVPLADAVERLTAAEEQLLLGNRR